MYTPEDAARSELDVLVEQLDELLSEGAVDPEDALEIAVVAGLASRLGADPSALADALAWRAGAGAQLLRELWDELDEDALVEAVDACATTEASEEQLEEAIYDVDEVVAAAIWAGRPQAVRALSRRVAEAIRQVPERFAAIADVGREFARLPAIGEWSDLYDYWFALADSGAWGDG